MILILQLRKLKHRGVEEFARGHTAKKGWSLDSKPGNLASESTALNVDLVGGRNLLLRQGTRS